MATIKTVSGNIKGAHGKSLAFFAKTSQKLAEYLKTKGPNGKPVKSIPYSVDVTLYEDRADVEARRKEGWPSESDILAMLNGNLLASERTKIVGEKHKEYGIAKPELKNDRLAQFRTMRGVFESMGQSRAEANASTEAALKFTEADAIADGEVEGDDDSAESAE